MAKIQLPSGTIINWEGAISDPPTETAAVKEIAGPDLNALGKALQWGADVGDSKFWDVFSFLSPTEIQQAGKKFAGSVEKRFGETQIVDKEMAGRGQPTYLDPNFYLMAPPEMVGDVIRERAQIAPTQEQVEGNPFASSGTRRYNEAMAELERIHPDFTEHPVLGFMNQVGTVVRDMGPALAAGYFTNWRVAPAFMSIQADLSTYADRRAAGENPYEASAGSHFVGSVEGATEYLPMGWLFKSGKPFLNRALDVTVGEGLQEGASSLLTSLWDKGTISPDMTLGDALRAAGYETLVGAAAGPVLAGIVHPFMPSKGKIIGQAMNDLVEGTSEADVERNMALLGMGPQQEIQEPQQPGKIYEPKPFDWFPTPEVEAGFKHIEASLQEDMFSEPSKTAGEITFNDAFNTTEDGKPLVPGYLADGFGEQKSMMDRYSDVLVRMDKSQMLDRFRFEIMRASEGFEGVTEPEIASALEKSFPVIDRIKNSLVANDLLASSQVQESTFTIPYRDTLGQMGRDEEMPFKVERASAKWHEIWDLRKKIEWHRSMKNHMLATGAPQEELDAQEREWRNELDVLENQYPPVWTLSSISPLDSREAAEIGEFPTLTQAVMFAAMTANNEQKYWGGIAEEAGSEPPAYKRRRETYTRDLAGAEKEIAESRHRSAVRAQVFGRGDEALANELAGPAATTSISGVPGYVLDGYPDILPEAVKAASRAATPEQMRILKERYPGEVARILPMMTIQAGDETSAWARDTSLQGIQLDAGPVMKLKVPTLKQAREMVDTAPLFQRDAWSKEPEKATNVSGRVAWIEAPSIADSEALATGLGMLADIGLNPNAWAFSLDDIHVIDGMDGLHGIHGSYVHKIGSERRNLFHLAINSNITGDMHKRTAFKDPAQRGAFLAVLAHELGHHVDREVRGFEKSPNSSESSPLFSVGFEVNDYGNAQLALGDVIGEIYTAYSTNTLGMKKFLNYPFGYMQAVVDAVAQKYAMDGQLFGVDVFNEGLSGEIRFIQVEAFAQLHALFYLYYTTPENVAALDAVFPKGMAMMKEINNAHYLATETEREEVIRAIIRGEIPSPAPGVGLPGFGPGGYRAISPKSIASWFARSRVEGGGMGGGLVGREAGEGAAGGDKAPGSVNAQIVNQENFQEWFGDSKVVDESGAPLVVYHGTVSDFSEFDRGKGEPGADWGLGFHFTNSVQDASDNYAGFGPDTTSKLEREAESIVDGLREGDLDPAEYGVTKEMVEAAEASHDGWSELLAAVQEEIKKYRSYHGGVAMPVYLSLQNPVVISEGGTVFELTTEFDEEGDVVSEEGSFLELLDAIRSVAPDFQLDGDQVAATVADAFDGESIAAAEVEAILRKQDPYLEEGTKSDMAPGEFVRSVFEYMDFDGIIDKTVNAKFGTRRRWGKSMSGVTPDTVHYIAFKPEQIKSAIGNRGTYSKESANILAMAVGPVSSVPLLTGEESASIKSTGKTRTPLISDIGFFLEGRAKHKEDLGLLTAKAMDDPLLASDLDGLVRRVSNVMLEEVRFWLGRDDSAATWYDDQIREMTKLIGDHLHKEIYTDPDMHMMFKLFLAITSNGEKVDNNFKMAEAAYKKWRKTGKFPRLTGKRAEAAIKAFDILNVMLEEKKFAWTRDFLSRWMTAGDLVKEIKQEFGITIQIDERVSEMVTGATVLGAKIGSFYTNLQGDFDTLTADLWFSRTFNRIIGHMFSVDAKPETQANRYAKLRKMIINGETESMLTVALPFDLDEVYSDERLLDELAEFVSEQVDYEFGQGIREKGDKTQWETSLGTLHKANQDMLQAAPRNVAERSIMRRAVRQVVDQLRNEGVPTNVASVQAILWYHEKALFEILKGKKNVFDEKTPEDYVGAAIKLIGWDNLTEVERRQFARYAPKRGRTRTTEKERISLYEPTQEEVATANRTSRSGGAVGSNAVVPRYVARTSSASDTILDFGAGKDALHARQLRNDGLNVTAHEFGSNQNQNHDPGALYRGYDTVYASNVLNVQSSVPMLEETVKQISRTTKGRAVFNYPQSPRKAGLSPEEVRQVIKKYFRNVRRVEGPASAPVWEATDPYLTGTVLYSNPFGAIQSHWKDVAESAIKIGEQAMSPITALGKVPNKRVYLTERYRFLGRLARVDEMARKIYDTFIDLSEPVSKAVYDYLTDPLGDVSTIPDIVVTRKENGRKQNVSIRTRARALKRLMNQIGDALVDEGLIPQESRDKFRDGYLPRAYLKYALEHLQIGIGAKVSNQGYTKYREEIPEEWRRVMGEITDPAYLGALGVTVPVRDLEIIRFLRSISRNREWVIPDYVVPVNFSTSSGQVRAQLGGQGDRAVSVFWLESEAARLRKQATHMQPGPRAETEQYAQDLQDLFDMISPRLPHPDTKVYRQVPNTARYGALRGMYLHHQIYDDLFPGKTAEGYTTLEAITRAWKVLKVPMNYPTVVRNVMSNMILLNMGGVPAYRIPDMLARASHEILHNGKHWRVAKMGGITNTTFTHNELYELNRDLSKLAAKYGTSPADGLPIRKMIEFVLNIVQVHSDFYQGIEQLFKTALIIDAMERQGMDEMDAIMAANEALFDYSLLPRWGKTVRRNVMGIPFLTFYYKAAGQVPRAFIRRPHLIAGYYAFWSALMAWSQAEFDLDDDDWEALLLALPRWLREKGNAWFVPIKDKHGRLQALDIGYLLPWAAHAQTIRNLGNGDITSAFEELGFLGAPIPSLIATVMSGTDPFTKQKVWHEADPPSKKAADMMNYLWRMAAPTYLTDIGFLGHMSRALTDQLDTRRAYYGQPTSTVPQAALRAIGINLYPVDPDSTRTANLLEYRRRINEVKSRMRRRLMEMSLDDDAAGKRQQIVDDYTAMILEIREEMMEYSDKSHIGRGAK